MSRDYLSAQVSPFLQNKRSMEVVTNYFDQITPSGNGQFHNVMVLSKDAANVVVFNNIAYTCR